MLRSRSWWSVRRRCIRSVAAVCWTVSPPSPIPGPGGVFGKQAVHAADHAAELAWREPALNAEDALKTAHDEIRTQRARIAEALGRIRDLELDMPQDAVQRLATENTTLKQQNRALAAEIKGLNDRLSAARGNNRSPEKQLSELQAELLDPTASRHLRPVRPTIDDGPAEPRATRLESALAEPAASATATSSPVTAPGRSAHAVLRAMQARVGLSLVG
jgi:hypothetical protein